MTSAKLEEFYRICAVGPSDINEHLPLLRDLASECEHVTEFGVGRANSTVAFLAAQPAHLISWDADPNIIVSKGIQALIREAGRTRFEPRVGNTIEISPIEPTDLLFIDSHHTASHLTRELVRHADPVAKTVKKFLVFHDTETYGTKGEDGSEPGLRAAIRQFQLYHAFPLWELIEDRKNCNGLVVLRRVRP